MKIFVVKFEKSYENITKYNYILLQNYPIYALVGRSNVGKSSFINWITGKKKISKVSSKPGSTRLINYFIINKKWYFIDLPGYGYSHIKSNDKLLYDFVLKKNYMLLFLLIDISIDNHDIDIEFIKILSKENIKFCICFTKIDKISNIKTNININYFINKIDKINIKIPIWFKMTIKNKFYKKAIIKYIYKKNKLFFISKNS